MERNRQSYLTQDYMQLLWCVLNESTVRRLVFPACLALLMDLIRKISLLESLWRKRKHQWLQPVEDLRNLQSFEPPFTQHKEANVITVCIQCIHSTNIITPGSTILSFFEVYQQPDVADDWNHNCQWRRGARGKNKSTSFLGPVPGGLHKACKDISKEVSKWVKEQRCLPSESRISPPSHNNSIISNSRISYKPSCNTLFLLPQRL